jgi:hypothetical protein
MFIKAKSKETQTNKMFWSRVWVEVWILKKITANIYIIECIKKGEGNISFNNMHEGMHDNIMKKQLVPKT